MEKFDNMQQNMVAEDDLDQISGGRKLFDIFTAEFRGDAKKPSTLEFHPDEEDDFRLTTLEMRVNPLKKKKNNPKITKL